jgi:hypothetical protein
MLAFAFLPEITGGAGGAGGGCRVPPAEEPVSSPEGAEAPPEDTAEDTPEDALSVRERERV